MPFLRCFGGKHAPHVRLRVKGEGRVNLVQMPRLSLNEDTCFLAEWAVHEGDCVKEGDLLFRAETDKSSLEVRSEFAGTVLKRCYGDNEVVPTLAVVCAIGQPGEDVSRVGAGEDSSATLATVASAPAAPASKITPVALEPPKRMPEAEVYCSPRARRLAQANGVDVSGLRATGAEGRIVEADVLAAMAAGSAAEAGEDIVRQKFTHIRKVIAQNMCQSLHGMAQLTNASLFNISQILDYREECKHDPDRKEITLGDMINFVLARTLAEHTYMNARMHGEDELEIHKRVHLGLAVDTERGLMVPTLFDAHKMTLPQLSRTSKELAQRCRAGTIPPEALKGATFTVSNLGALGIRMFTPVINPPQVAILGVGCVDYMMKKTREGMLYYPACTLSLTYDHRAVDGAPASRFLQALCRNLENFSLYR